MNTIRETGEMAKKWELYHLVFIQHWMITKHSMQAENSLSKFVVCNTFYLECWWGAFASNSWQIHNKLLTSDMCNTFYLELPNYHFLFVLLLSAVLNNSPSHSVLCILKNYSVSVFWRIIQILYSDEFFRFCILKNSLDSVFWRILQILYSQEFSVFWRISIPQYSCFNFPLCKSNICISWWNIIVDCVRHLAVP